MLIMRLLRFAYIVRKLLLRVLRPYLKRKGQKLIDIMYITIGILQTLLSNLYAKFILVRLVIFIKKGPHLIPHSEDIITRAMTKHIIML